MSRFIDTIIFDMGGVLVDYDLERCFRAFDAIGLPEVRQWVNPYRQEGVFAQIEQGTISREDFYRHIEQQVGRKVDHEAIDRAWCSFLLTIPEDKLNLLRELRQQGYRVYMLSNTNEIMFDWMRHEVFTAQGLTVMDYFDQLFLSYEMKLLKPSPAIFEKMIQQGAITPQQALFIDDAELNVATAAQLGFYTYQPCVHEDFRSLFALYSLKK